MILKPPEIGPLRHPLIAISRPLDPLFRPSTEKRLRAIAFISTIICFAGKPPVRPEHSRRLNALERETQPRIVRKTETAYL